MFRAIKFSDISKSQMISATQKLKVTNIKSSSKEDLAIALADVFIEQKFVKITKELLYICSF